MSTSYRAGEQLATVQFRIVDKEAFAEMWGQFCTSMGAETPWHGAVVEAASHGPVFDHLEMYERVVEDGLGIYDLGGVQDYISEMDEEAKLRGEED